MIADVTASTRDPVLARRALPRGPGMSPRRSLQRATAGVLVGFALLGAAGCGGSQSLSREDYTREVRELERAARQENRSPQDGGAASAVAELDLQRERLEEFVRGLERLEPPEEIRRANELMISGVRDLATQLRALARVLREGDVQTAQRLAGALRRSQGYRDLERAGQILRAEGYDPIKLPGAEGAG